MERRLSRRVKMDLPIRINRYRKKGGILMDDFSYLEGEAVNISDSGGCFTSEVQLETNSRISFHLASSSVDNPEIRASIIWKEAPLNDTYNFRYGLKFLDSTGHGLDFLREAIVSEEGRLSGRGWEASHPDTIFPTLPLSSKVFDDIAPTALSVDVTNLCNLKCKHCFWHSYKGSLSADTNKKLLYSVREALERFPSITNITWYGGEPLICKETRELVDKGLILRKNNLIMTNGTFALPEWRGNAHFGISIDGNREVYAYLRGTDAYSRIRKNILTALKKELRVFILYCINSVNISCIPEFLEDWSGTKISGIGFTAYTPIKGKGSDLDLSDKDREKAVFILKHMKRQYGDLITNTDTMIELIRGKYGEELAENCPMNAFNNCGKIYSVHMCNDGTIRVPCALGKGAYHKDCRSITKIALYAGKVLHDRSSFATLLRMYSSVPNRKKRVKDKIMS